MIVDNLSLTQVVTSIESVLKLEYSAEAKLQETMTAAIHRLEDTYGVTIDKDVYVLQAENQLGNNALSHFLEDVVSCLKQLSLYTCLNVYQHSFTFTLSDVNYLGVDREKLLMSLKFFQDIDLYEQRGKVVVPISDAVDAIPLNIIKRMFVCMLLFEKLGIVEGVVLLAQLLYMGGIVQ